MEYDRGDSFPFVFEPDGIPSGSKQRKTVSTITFHSLCKEENFQLDHNPFKFRADGNLFFSECLASELLFYFFVSRGRRLSGPYLECNISMYIKRHNWDQMRNQLMATGGGGEGPIKAELRVHLEPLDTIVIFFSVLSFFLLVFLMHWVFF